MQEFFKDSRFKAVDFDGCRLGVVDNKGLPIKKPWRLMTTSPEMVEAFKGLFCKHKPDEHGEARGKTLERTGFYTQASVPLWFLHCLLLPFAMTRNMGRYNKDLAMLPLWHRPPSLRQTRRLKN